MKPDQPSCLLKEVLAGEELADFRRTSLERGLSAIRRQQRRQRILRFGALLMLPLLFTFAIRSRRAPEDSNQPLASPAIMGATIPTRPADALDAKFITDEELFALFPNRPLALVGRPGHQQLVFLDQAKSRRRQ